MSFTYGFYNSIDGDRTYDADQFGDMFSGLITDGVYASIGDAFMVTPGGTLSVVVGTGRAWFNKTWNWNSTRLTLNLELADLLLPRYDMVVLEVDKNSFSRCNSIKVITGTPSANPEKPAYSRTSNVYQYPLAYISVRQNQETIEAKDIEVTVGRAPCPFVTGMLESADITPMYQQWQQQFQEWFSVVQATLSDDAAGMLLNMIDSLQTRVTTLENDRVKVADRASESDYLQRNDNKWISARFAATYLKAVNDNTKTAVFTSSGVFTAPSNLVGDVTVVIVGGGGGGGSNAAIDILLNRRISYDSVDSSGNQCTSTHITRGSVIAGGKGGARGNMITATCKMTPGQSYSVTVGAGGVTATTSAHQGIEVSPISGVTKEYYSSGTNASGHKVTFDIRGTSGTNGGASSVNTDAGLISAAGGTGGVGGQVRGWYRWWAISGNGFSNGCFGEITAVTGGSAIIQDLPSRSSVTDAEDYFSTGFKYTGIFRYSPNNGSAGYSGGLGGLGGQKKATGSDESGTTPVFPPPGGCPNNNTTTGKVYKNSSPEEYCSGGDGGYNSDAPGRVYTTTPGGYTAVDQYGNCIAKTGGGGVLMWGNGGSGIVILTYNVRG